jgi:hypothetical protein
MAEGLLPSGTGTTTSICQPCFLIFLARRVPRPSWKLYTLMLFSTESGRAR